MFEIRIETGNAAFEEDALPYEVARILRKVADDIETGKTDGLATDVNGNGVGSWTLNN